jgi:hypothetical protein
METEYDLDLWTDSLIDASWFISQEVIHALEGVGLTAARALRSFILIAQSSEVVLEGAVEAELMGLSLRVERRGLDIFVDLL